MTAGRTGGGQPAIGSDQTCTNPSEPPALIEGLERSLQRLSSPLGGGHAEAHRAAELVRRRRLHAGRAWPAGHGGQRSRVLPRAPATATRIGADAPAWSNATRCDSRSMRAAKSSFLATTISAAAEGVGARRSATKSAIVTSVSWPTAEIVGTGQPCDRPRDDLLVERPEIFDRSTAAPDDHDVNRGYLPDRGNRGGNLERRTFSLDAGWTNDDVRVGVAAAQHVNDVADRRSIEGRDDPDLPRAVRAAAAFGPDRRGLPPTVAA